MRVSTGVTRATPRWRPPLTRPSSPPSLPQPMGLGPTQALRPRSVALRKTFLTIVNYNGADQCLDGAANLRELRAVSCKCANSSAYHCPEVYANFARTYTIFVFNTASQRMGCLYKFLLCRLCQWVDFSFCLTRHCKLTCIAYCLLSVFFVMGRGSGEKGRKAFTHIKSRQHRARRLRTLQYVVSGEVGAEYLV